MAITIGIKKFVCIEGYPETDHNLLKDAGIEMVVLDKNKIVRWAKDLVGKYEN